MSEDKYTVFKLITLAIMLFIAGYVTGMNHANDAVRDSIQLTEQAQTKALQCLEMLND